MSRGPLFSWCGRCRWRILLALLVLAAGGCGGAHPSSVSGVVMFEGKPLPTGTVTFHPTGGGAAAYSRLDASGHYTITTGTSQGLEPGEYKITVVAVEVIPGPNPGDAPSGRRITPELYQNLDSTPLRFTVKRGGSTFDMVLESKP